MYSVNDRVIINDPGSTDHGKVGVVIAIEKRDYPYQVQVDGDDIAFWYAGSMLNSPVAMAESNEGSDFDRGFGIGGLGRHAEPPIIPSEQALERYERKAAEARTCRRCGQTDIFDGAMFTTLGGSGICDDCVG